MHALRARIGRLLPRLFRAALSRALLLAAALVFLVPIQALTGVTARADAPASSPDEEQPPRGLLVLPSGRQLRVEIADTPARMRTGYMFRDRVADDEGMVFLMGQKGLHAVWMKNCRVALDVVWLDADWRVVHLERNVPPCAGPPCPIWTPPVPASSVLEVRAGLAAEEGVGIGSRTQFLPPEPLPGESSEDGLRATGSRSPSSR